jgi:hypothetical protein
MKTGNWCNPTAFPSSSESGTYFGMTLRDYFAAVALSQCQVDTAREKDDPLSWEELVAKNAYQMADAMLAERIK